MPFDFTLIENPGQLRELVEPVLRGEVAEAAIDTETTPVTEGRFTAYGTPTRMAGFSISFEGVDLYCPVRHAPYDWRRRIDLVRGDGKNDGAGWVRKLIEKEGVTEGGAWAPGRDPNVDLGESLVILQELLDVPAVTWFAHNWLFDASMLKADGLTLPWDRMEDTQTLNVFTDPRPVDAWNEEEKSWVHGGHGLKHLGEVWLGIPSDAQALLDQARKALGVQGAKLEDFSMLPLRTALAPYAAMDTRLTLRLAHHCQGRKAFRDPKVQDLILGQRHERRLVDSWMEAGIAIDVEEARARCSAKELEREEATNRARRAAGGRRVPVTSPDSLRKFLYGELGFPTYRQADDTRDATLKKVRAKIVADGHAGPELSVEAAVELLDAIRDYRSVDKELTAFYRPLARTESDRVHPVLRPLQARTTRYACEKPNLQQAKKPKKDGSDPRTSVRHLFKPDEGFAFLCCDYSAQEMRVASHFTLAIPRSFEWRFSWPCTLKRRGDCKGRAPHGPGEIHTGWRANYSTRPDRMRLAEGFLGKGTSFDPHARMVELVAEHELGITRDQAKTANFAILYGAGSRKLAETLDCSEQVARALLKLFWEEAYPELERVREFAGERIRKGNPETRFSGADHLSALFGGWIHLDGSYKATNYLIQRSCREILQRATLAVDEYLTEQQAHEDYRIAFPVHDELVFQVREAALDQGIVQGITEAMVRAADPCRIPMVVEPALARESWAVKEDLPKDWGCDGVALGLGVKLEDL